MDKDILVYVSALKDSLRDKQEILKKLLEYSKLQEAEIAKEEFDYDSFEQIMQEKEVFIEKLQSLDAGFDSIYARVGQVLKLRQQEFKPHIMEMQNYIRANTDIGVQIQTLEYKNRDKLELIFSGKKREIKDFKVNNRMANSYYQNMANQHQSWQTYFLDKKK